MPLPSSLARSALHALADRLQRVDVEARVGLVEDRVLRREDRELQHLEPLLLTAGEAVVDVAPEERRIHVQRVEPVEDQLAELRRRQVVGAHGLTRGAQKVRDRDARDRGRILEREKQAGFRALVRREREQVRAVERRGAAGDLVSRVAGEREGERRLAAPVRSHQRVDASRLDGQIDPFEDLVVLDARREGRARPGRAAQTCHGIVERHDEKVKETLDYLRGSVVPSAWTCTTASSSRPAGGSSAPCAVCGPHPLSTSPRSSVSRRTRSASSSSSSSATAW